MKMTDKLFRAIMRNLHAYVLLINREHLSKTFPKIGFAHCVE